MPPLLLAVLPLLLPIAIGLDLLGRRRGSITRLVGMGIAWSACECLGILASLALWVASAGQTSSEASQRWHFRLQVLWARALLASAVRLFDLRVTVDHESAPTPGPLLVLVRHVSMLDTLLPAVFLSGEHGLRLRYALKRELLVDPCLDVVGQRMPNVFLARGTGRGAEEAATLAGIARGLAPDEGVLLYPEGTRFSPERRARALERVAASRPERLERLSQLTHVLPPRSAGLLALFEAAPEADALFVAHHGLEGIRSPADVISGGLVGRRIEVATWRVAASERPTSAEERLAWIDAQWARVDAWLAERSTIQAEGTRSASLRDNPGARDLCPNRLHIPNCPKI